MARDQGLPVEAIPVFLHRRFRPRIHLHQHLEGHSGSGRPCRRKIGLKQFQATAIVWMRGILQHEYGVPLEAIEWFCELDETIDFERPPHLKITQCPKNVRSWDLVPSP
jgi:4,5-dihydroxyphthalate decarboxylase